MLSRRAVRAVSYSALVTLALAQATPNTATLKDHKSGDFDWKTITPSWDLEYSPCYDGDFECARLTLPLDWLEEDPVRQKAQSVSVAVIKLPAVVPPSDETYGGVVHINPGGPGDSGILHIRYNGVYMRNMMDTEGVRHFDLVSFDPRGMANSLPIADCFEDEVTRSMNGWQSQGVPYARDGKYSNASLAMELSQAKALGIKCASRKGPDGVVIQEYMSTASVARDMLRMVEEEDRLGKEQREVVVGDGAQKKLGGGGASPKTEESPPRIQYYGTSYGTQLGNTFVSMFPGRVKRMVLDGVVVPEDYIAVDWCPFLEDTTAAFDYFYQTCSSAGSAKCPLARDEDKSWHDVKARVNDLIARLDADPIPVAVEGVAPTVLAGVAVTGRMMDPVYAPIQLYPGLAETLAAAVEGNYTALVAESGFAPGQGKAACESETGDAAAYKWMALAGTAVRCGDADDVRDRDPAYWRAYRQRCVAKSAEIGAMWADLTCSGWQSRPKDRFAGPFESPAHDAADVEGKPSAPVLLLSSRHDPVTPLVSAHAVSKKHPGSRVVVQESTGHCSMLSAPSECTRKIFRAYMNTGVMPEDGVSCKADCVPWEECDQPTARLPR